jgi:hypothetical protein
MPKIKVYRARRFESQPVEGYRLTTRMYTREAIEASKLLEILSDTEVEIDADELETGEGWTRENFVPKNSN